jgi:hypothetical protein
MELVAQGVKPQDVDTAGPAEVKKAEAVCRECYLSCMLLCGADNSRYHQLKVDLSNDMTKGTDNFPKTMVETTRILNDYVPPPRLQRLRDPDGEGLAFVQGEGGASRGPKKDSANKVVECWHCGGPHYKNECPELSFWTRASRTSTSIRAMKSTPYSLQTMDTALSINRQKECGGSCLLTKCTSTHV